jgi:hypothetical protein
MCRTGQSVVELFGYRKPKMHSAVILLMAGLLVTFPARVTPQITTVTSDEPYWTQSGNRCEDDEGSPQVNKSCALGDHFIHSATVEGSLHQLLTAEK